VQDPGHIAGIVARESRRRADGCRTVVTTMNACALATAREVQVAAEDGLVPLPLDPAMP